MHTLLGNLYFYCKQIPVKTNNITYYLVIVLQSLIYRKQLIYKLLPSRREGLYKPDKLGEVQFAGCIKDKI